MLRFWRELKINERNVLLWANVGVCLVVAIGFFAIATLTYQTNRDLFRNDIEFVSVLNSERLRRRFEGAFVQSVNVAQTIAGGQLFPKLVAQEPGRAQDNQKFLRDVCAYLRNCKDRYHFATISYASVATGLYYHPETGIDRTLEVDDPDDAWFFGFLQSSERYRLTVERDQTRGSAHNYLAFIACRVSDSDGKALGVLGVGIPLDNLQDFIDQSSTTQRMVGYLVNNHGTIQIAGDASLLGSNLFDSEPYAQRRYAIMTNRGQQALSWWYDYDSNNASFSDNVYERAAAITQRYLGDKRGFLVEMYLPTLDWHLVVDYDTSDVESRLMSRFQRAVIVIAVIVIAVMFAVVNIIKRYNKEMLRITEEKIQREAFQEETEKLYYAIFEIDMTHDLLVNDQAKAYAVSMGISEYTPYSDVIEHIAKTKVHPDYRDAYLRMMAPDNVRTHHDMGVDSLTFEFLVAEDVDGTPAPVGKYHWMRTMTRAFIWDQDRSLRVLMYRQNIDREKNRELVLMEELQRDGLSGLYNKMAMQTLVKQTLQQAPPDASYAFFILDIDDFKTVNDTCGHIMGDEVIADFAGRIKRQFRANDMIGRIGGDEFAVLVPVHSREWVAEKAATLGASLWYEFQAHDKTARISASIGVAISPEAGTDFETLYHNADKALYATKDKGKNSFSIWSPDANA